MLLIGLSGKKGVGKNFVADRIEEYARKNGWSIEVAAFASPLKEFCITVLGLDRQACYGNDQDKNSMTHHKWDNMPQSIKGRYKKSGQMSTREVLQVFGTDIVRGYWDKEAWVNAMARRISQSTADLFVITDVRFPNESDAIKGMGGEVWIVDGPQRGDEDKKNDAHESETAMASIQPTRRIINGYDDDAQSILDQIAMAIAVGPDATRVPFWTWDVFERWLAIALCFMVGSWLVNVNFSAAMVFFGTGIVMACWAGWRLLSKAFWTKRNGPLQ